MTKLNYTLCFALTLCVALASTDAYAQRRGGGRRDEGGGNRGNNSAPRVEQPRVETPRVETPRVEQPRVRVPEVRTPSVRVPEVRTPSVRVPEVRTPSVRVPEARVPGVSGNASGRARVDGGNARVRTDAGGNVRVGDGRVRGDGRIDGRFDSSVRRAGATFPNTVDREVNQAIYRNNIDIGRRSVNIAPNNYRGSWQNYPWHRGYWNSYYGWNPQIGYGQGYYGNYGGYGIRLGNFAIGTGGYGGYGNYGRFDGYGYGRYPIGWGYGGWGLGSSLYASGYMPYFNPYWGGGIGPGYVYNYAQPIYVTTTASASDLAMREIDSARDAFKSNDLDTALRSVDRAIKENPSDEALHQFRALTLFAMKDFNGAAATIHSVLAVGPGWDWGTMASHYADVSDYTAQLRALESYSKGHAEEAGPQFLLGYHYMTTGHPDAAAKQFANVVKLEPKDRVAREMLALVDKPKEGAGDIVSAPPPVPTEEGAPAELPREAAQPISIQTIAGTWHSSRDDGSKFDLDLKADKTFTWKFNQGSRNEEFSGTYTTEGSLLVLQRQDGGAMVGHVAQDGAGKFTFKLLGAPQDDPGLAFSR